MDMPKPGPGHLRLESLAGLWEGKERMYPSQWEPEGGITIGRRKSQIALNGFALITDYEQERDGKITFTGHGVLSFDPKSERYSLHWFDCMGSAPEIFEGSFDGDILMLAHGGPGMHARFTYDLSDPQQMLSKMEMSQDGDIWNTFFEARYQRG